MLWSNQATGLHVMDLPAFYRDYIVENAPSSPRILRPRKKDEDDASAKFWKDIREALEQDPDSTVATIPTTLWPHQERFRQQNVRNEPVKRLIADEVGLGKTLQAGVILKTRLNQGSAKKALIIAPKAATRQWQDELIHEVRHRRSHHRHPHPNSPRRNHKAVPQPAVGRSTGNCRTSMAGPKCPAIPDHLR